jgi:PAS domain S-box-containing protein
MNTDDCKLVNFENFLSLLEFPGIVVNRENQIVLSNSFFDEMVGIQNEIVELSPLDCVFRGGISLKKSPLSENDTGHISVFNDTMRILINDAEVELTVSVIPLSNSWKVILFDTGTITSLLLKNDLLDIKTKELVLRISTEFTKCNVDGIDEQINISLEKLGKHTGSDRAYIFMIDDHNASISNTHEWCSNGISPEVDNLQNIPMVTLPWWMEQLHDFKFIHTQDVSKMPAEAQNEKNILQSQNIKSILIIPIFNENSLIGFVGFDAVQDMKKWSNSNVEMLRIVANMYGALIVKYEYIETCNSLKNHYSAAFNVATAPTVIIDKNRLVIDANRQWKDIFYYNPEYLIGRDGMELIHPKYIETMKQYHEMRRSPCNEAPREYETVIRDFHGNNREAKLVVSIVPNTSNSIVSVFDLTKVRKHEKLVNMLTGLNASDLSVVEEKSFLTTVCNELVRVGGYTSACFCEIEKSEDLNIQTIAKNKTYDLSLCAEMLKYLNQNDVEEKLKKDQAIIFRDLVAYSGVPSISKFSESNNFGSIIVIPIIIQMNSRILTLTLYSEESNSFDEIEARLLEDLKQRLLFIINSFRKDIDSMHAIEKSGLQFKELAEQTIATLRAVVNIRDPYIANHQEKVALLAKNMAIDLGLSDEQVEEIFIAASIHDIGKINVPSDILNKPGRLTKHEFGIIKEHCRTGSDIIGNLNLPWKIARIIIEHHERINGSGYPRGINGNEISIGARIVSVADVFDAISTHRPYRPALGKEAAIKELRDGCGIIYDEDIVNSLVRVVTIEVLEA